MEGYQNRGLVDHLRNYIEGYQNRGLVDHLRNYIEGYQNRGLVDHLLTIWKAIKTGVSRSFT